MYAMMVGNFDSVTGEVTDLGVHLGGNEYFVVLGVLKLNWFLPVLKWFISGSEVMYAEVEMVLTKPEMMYAGIELVLTEPEWI